MTTLYDLEPTELNLENHLIIDVRREEEWKETGIIEGSHLITFFDSQGSHDIQTWIYKLNKLLSKNNKEILLVCARANRTRIIGNYFIDELKYENVTHLKGGIVLWQELNLPLEKV